MFIEEFLKFCQKIGIYDVLTVTDIFDSVDFRKTGRISLFNFVYIQAGNVLTNRIGIDEDLNKIVNI